MRSIIILALAILLAPFYSAVILKVKAFFAVKKDHHCSLIILLCSSCLKKDRFTAPVPLYIFKLGPIVSYGLLLSRSSCFYPLPAHHRCFSFNGDVIFLSLSVGTWTVFHNRRRHGHGLAL